MKTLLKSLLVTSALLISACGENNTPIVFTDTVKNSNVILVSERQVARDSINSILEDHLPLYHTFREVYTVPEAINLISVIVNHKGTSHANGFTLNNHPIAEAEFEVVDGKISLVDLVKSEEGARINNAALGVISNGSIRREARASDPFRGFLNMRYFERDSFRRLVDRANAIAVTPEEKAENERLDKIRKEKAAEKSRIAQEKIRAEIKARTAENAKRVKAEREARQAAVDKKLAEQEARIQARRAEVMKKLKAKESERKAKEALRIKVAAEKEEKRIAKLLEDSRLKKEAAAKARADRKRKLREANEAKQLAREKEWAEARAARLKNKE